ncbi:MAG: DUF4367 domain-containing protein [Bacillota bacterium]|nr:DUF4367 domain-containing protein [Bacillota bacterium]
MSCPDKGAWQAYLDKEIADAQRVEFEEHAAHCSRCKKILEELIDLADWTDNRLTRFQHALDERISKHNPSRHQAPNTLVYSKKKEGMGRMSNKFKKWTAVAASVLLLTGVLSLAPVQEAVADLLSVFRVQKIQMVKVSPEEMQQMARAIETKVGEVDLKQFGKMEVTKKPEQVKVSLAEAQAELPFEVKQPDYIPAGLSLQEKVSLHRGGKAQFSLQVEQANALLKGLGAQTLLPSSLEGKTFSVHVPAGVRMEFSKNDQRTNFSLAQFATPEVTVPSGVDARDLRAALLDLPILPEDFRKQLASIEDWQNTMVIPDTGEGKLEKLSIGGNEAIYAQNMGGWSHLMWVDQGVIFQLSGMLDRAEAVKIAESLY